MKKYIIIIGAAVVLLALIGGISAKYIYSDGGRNLLSAKEFYFTSDLLTEDTGKYVLNATAQEVSFTLENHIDKLRFSQDTITYTVSVECKEGLSEGEAVPVLSAAAGELKGDEISTQKLTLSNLVRGKTYVVTATGEAGYKQTLKAEFYVSDSDENVYKHLDTSNSTYVLLTVWTENVDGDLVIDVNTLDLIPDNTDPILRGVYNYKDGIYGMMTGEGAIKDTVNFQNAYSSYTYRFFKDNAEVPDIEQFHVIVDGRYIATAGVPK